VLRKKLEVGWAPWRWYCCIHQRSDAVRTYLRYCPVRTWTRLRFLEGARDRRWPWSETSTHFHWYYLL